MNLGFSAEHEAIREEFRKLLADAPPRRFLKRASPALGFDTELWQRMAELGWLATAIPIEHGGSGLEQINLCVLAEETGRSLSAVPFTASICGFAIALEVAGNSEAMARWLPQVAAGSAIGVVFTRDCWLSPPQLHASAGQWYLTGSATHVLDGACAHAALACIGSGSDCRLVCIGLARGVEKKLAARPLDVLHATATLQFDAAAVQVLATGPDAQRKWEEILNRYALFVAFEQLGGALGALEMARQHCLNRYAFGRAIGSFQALKHMLADMLVAIELARSNCFFGAAALSLGNEAMAEAAAVARISASEAFRCCARGNIQVHGALGVTWESDCHLYYRRAQALAASPGAPRFWKERLIELLVRRRTPQSETPPLALAGVA